MKQYKFSITKQYVSDWGLIEGVREILQNAIDSPGEMKINYENECLSITSRGIKLPVASLLMGYGTKSNDCNSIGGKCEGSLLAIATLEREGYPVTVMNADEKWEPKFEYDEEFEQEILKIEVSPISVNVGGLTYNIENITEYDMEILRDEFPQLEEEISGEMYDFIETQCGEIILDEKYAGRMFVEGLPIQRDDNFQFGYNFKASYVKLDRDRKAINYYELRSLTAQSLVTAEECHPEIFKAISDSCVDAKDIIEVLDDANDDFLESYRNMFYEEHDLSENTLVATSAIKKQLNQLDENINVVEGSEIESFLIAKANDKLDLIYEAKETINNKSQLEKDFDNFILSNYLKFMEIFIKIKKYLPKKWQTNLKELINSLSTPAYRKIEEKFIDENFKYTSSEAYELKNKIINNI